ncbi:MAG: hypothetical protein ABFS28_14925 [Bacteroidota bacterium]
MRRRTVIVILIALITITLYLFWGPLFPWNPIKTGFRKIESQRATMYITEYDNENDVLWLEELLKEEEEFHALKFKQDFKIIVLGKDSNMKRFLPWLQGTGYSVKLGSLNVIYIGPNARKSPYGIGVYLKHEISHLLMHQHTFSHEKNMEILKQAWLAEGVATYFGGPHYFTKKEFVDLWNSRGLQFNSLYMENPHDMDSSIIRLKYTYYRFFIEYLVETYGMERLQVYIKSYVCNPKSYNDLFPKVYDNDLDEVLQGFKAYMETPVNQITRGYIQMKSIMMAAVAPWA